MSFSPKDKCRCVYKFCPELRTKICCEDFIESYNLEVLGIILNMKIFDLHNDFLTEIKKDSSKNKYLKSSKNKSVETICGAVWTSKMDAKKTFDILEKSFEFVHSHSKNQKENETKLLLSIEDLHFVSKLNIDRVINLHPCSVTLTWNQNNNLAGGVVEGGDLTLFGAEIVRVLEDSGIFVDTAHLSEKSFMSFAKITQKPIFCSHANVFSLTANSRNLKDYQLQMIKESGGLVGICFVQDFLTTAKTATIGDIARHIDFVVSRFGKEFCALGTDFFGTKHLPKYVKNYESLKLLEDRLRFMGYDSETIQDIFFGNAKRFFEKQTNNFLFYEN